jgi:hypothetical protein
MGNFYVCETHIQVRGRAGGDGETDVATPSSTVEGGANWAAK